jgi:hypothetical protein
MSQKPIKKNLPPENQIVLSFEDKDTARYVRTICRRKGISLEAYILDNFEWDDPLPCVYPAMLKPKEITADICEGCDQAIGGKCPDVTKRGRKR